MTKLKNLLLSVLFLINADHAFASVITASSFGFDPNNATPFFQAAIQSSYDTVIVDKQATDWNVGPSHFFNLANKTIIFEAGVKLKAIVGAFNNTSASLMRFTNGTNIQIIGYGAEFKMNRAEYAVLNNSEHRMNIWLSDCSNFTIRGLVINESGGDGIYIGGDGVNYCENILVEDVQCINHYRQGMSITNVQDMLVKNSLFANTQGTLPEAGVDVEPYQTTQRVVNLRFQNCAFKNNGWSGLALALSFLDNSSLPVSIEVNDCYFKKNGRPGNIYSLCEIYLSANYASPVQGTVTFKKCFIDSSEYSALYTRKTSNAYLAKFENCVFQNISRQQILYNDPIFLEVPSYSNPSGYLGGLEFNDVLISYQTNFNFFRVYGWSTLAGIKDISGHFTVVEPNNNPPLYTNVANSVNITYTYTNQTSLPATSVGLTVQGTAAIECNEQKAYYTFSRSSLNTAYPLGVSYSQTGIATPGNDVYLKTGGAVIPTNLLLESDSTFARKDLLVEGNETEIIKIKPSSFYNIAGTDSVIIQVADCTPLPLRLLNFYAIKQNSNALLQWNADDVSDIIKYTIEQSINGINFIPIINLNKTQCPGIFCDWLHFSPGEGIHYYRLKVTEQSGRVIYSTIRKLEFGKEDGEIFSVFPVPAKDVLNISIAKNILGSNLFIRIIDAMGVTVFTRTYAHVSSTFNAVIDISFLSQGSYVIQTGDSRRIFNKKWIKITGE